MIPKTEELPVPATAEKWRANSGGGFQSRNTRGTESSNRKEKQPALCETDRRIVVSETARGNGVWANVSSIDNDILDREVIYKIYKFSKKFQRFQFYFNFI